MTVAEDLAMTFELCGSGTMSEAAARLFLDELRQFPEPWVHAALVRCRREVTGRLALAHVIERIDDGRPGPEEAWAMVPKSESDSAAMTGEVWEAMFVALPLINAGDLIGGRMAFLEAYRGRVSKARAEREPISWRITYGHDKAGREAAQRDLDKRIGREELPEIEGPVDVSEVPRELRAITSSLAEKKVIDMRARRDNVMDDADRAHAEGRMCRTGCDRCMPLH